MQKLPLMHIEPVNLSRRICPGCGMENPHSNSIAYFSCSECDWECEINLPTLEQIMSGKYPDFTLIRDVDLVAYLNTIFKYK